jgi:hypothetical protein
MVDRPSHLWKGMPLDKRVQAAEAFWRDTESPDIEAQQAEAIAAVARQFKFRPRTVLSLPIDRRARQLAHMPDVSDAIATRALIAYHFSRQRPLMAAFLDALGIAHDNGLISAEEVAPPDRERLAAAIAAVKTTFDAGDVNLYLKTLAALDGDTWQHLDAAMSA